MQNLSVALACLLLIATIHLSLQAPNLSKADWLRRKAAFYHATKFNLTDENLHLIGRRRIHFENNSTLPEGHLPFWFDYELFRAVFRKPTPVDSAEEVQRHHAYISACMRTIKLRVLYRMLAGTQDSFITKDADRLYWELYGHPEVDELGQNGNGLSIFVNTKFESDINEEAPLARAVRLMKEEMSRVESRNQVEHYLRAFDEVDGSAILGELPY